MLVESSICRFNHVSVVLIKTVIFFIFLDLDLDTTTSTTLKLFSCANECFWYYYSDHYSYHSLVLRRKNCINSNWRTDCKFSFLTTKVQNSYKDKKYLILTFCFILDHMKTAEKYMM